MSKKMRILLTMVLFVIVAAVVFSAIAVPQGITLADGLGSLSQLLWFDGASTNGSCVPSIGCVLGT